MSIERIYYKVGPGKTLDVLQAMNAELQRQYDAAWKWLKSIGAVAFIRRGGCIVSVKFAGGTEHGPLWRRSRDHRDHWEPVRKSKEGKALAKQMQSFKLGDSFECGARLGIPEAWTGNMIGLASYEKYGDTFILSVPIPGERPMISNPNAPKWTPGPDLREMKMSEVWDIREKHYDGREAGA